MVPWTPFTLPHVPAKTAERSLQCSQEGVGLQQTRGSAFVAEEGGSHVVDIPKCGGGFHIRLLQGGHESDGRVEGTVADRAPTHSQIARNRPVVRSWLWMSCGRVEGWRETAPRPRLARTSCRTERTSSPDLRRVYISTPPAFSYCGRTLHSGACTAAQSLLERRLNLIQLHSAAKRRHCFPSIRRCGTALDPWGLGAENPGTFKYKGLSQPNPSVSLFCSYNG